MLTSLKSVHETLSQERQRLQEVCRNNNPHQSNTLTVVRLILLSGIGEHVPSSGFFSLAVSEACGFLCLSLCLSLFSLEQQDVRPTVPPQWQTRLQSILMPVMTSFAAAPLRFQTSRDLAMAAPATLSLRRVMVGTSAPLSFSMCCQAVTVDQHCVSLHFLFLREIFTLPQHHSVNHPQVPCQHFQGSQQCCTQEHRATNYTACSLSRQQPCGPHGYPLQ